MANKKKKNVYAEELEKIESGNYTSKIFTGNEKLEIAPLPGSNQKSNITDNKGVDYALTALSVTNPFWAAANFGYKAYKNISNSVNNTEGSYFKSSNASNPVEGAINTIINGTSSFAQGVYDIGDKAAQFTTLGIAQLMDWGGNEDFANKLRKSVYSDESEEMKRKYTVGGWNKAINEATDEKSYLGEKSQAVGEGIGYYAGMKALEEVGIPWQVTAGVTTAGDELTNAYKNGAEDWEAWTSAAGSATAEILSEYLSGGLKLPGTGKTTEALTGALVDKVKDKVAKGLIGFGINMVGEGIEENVSGVAQEIIRRLTYMRDDEKNLILNALEGAKDYASQQALEDFINGALVSGITMGTSPQTYKSIKQGRNLVTGYTSDEQKVIDNEVNKIVAERTKDGNKLSKKQINKIEEDVKNSLAKGQISTADIENTLGLGDRIKTEANKVELSLGRELSKDEYNSLSSEVRNKFINDNNAFTESYLQDQLRRNKFEMDMSKVDEKLQDFYQKAIDSGMLNNTRDTHNFVDMLAKIHKDKGIDFDFTNNEKLAESGFALDGKTINGYVTDNGITLNLNSKNALESTVGHEITHVLEGTDMYDALAKSIKEYAESKGEYAKRLKEVQDLYKDVENADATKELTADLVGDYLFTNQEFINHLTQNRNLFQKIYDEIKYLVKQVTAGSKEERKLNKAMKMFEKAYKDNSVKLAEQETSTQPKFSITQDSDGRELSLKQQELFKDEAPELLDDEGRLKLAYHGTVNPGFTIFKPSQNKSVFGKYKFKNVDVNYFTASKDTARGYTELGVEENGNIYKVYLHITNPYTVENTSNATVKSWRNIKDNNIRQYETEYYNKFENKWNTNKSIENNLEEINTDLFPFNCELRLNGDYYELYDLGKNDGRGETQLLYVDKNANTNDLFDEDIKSSIYGETFDDYYYASDNIVKWVLTMNTDGYNYDGIIIPDIVDTGLRGDLFSEPTTDYVVFNSNQIKNIDNLNPTDNPDIRYSLSSTGEMVDNTTGEKVELDVSDTGNTGNLMAIHNLNAKKLKGILELGGFPVPSIAITKTDNVGSNQFGDISVLFDKETINPERIENEVYDRDVWTPTFPRIEYDIDNSMLRKFGDENLFNDDNDEILSSVKNHYLYSENLADKINNYGIENVTDKMKQDSQLKYVYLKTMDNNYQAQTKDAKYSKDYDNETLKQYIDMYNNNPYNEMPLKDFYYHYLNYQDMNLTDDQRQALKSTIRDFVYKEAKQKAIEKYNEYKQNGHDFGDTTKDKFINGYTDLLMENYDNSYWKWQEFIRDAAKYDEYGERQVMDENKTLQQAEQDINQEKFEKWVDDTFGEMLKTLEKGIRNDVDLFTPSGNRRDFNQLHEKYNLQNVVKLMTKQKTVAGEEGFGSGSGFGTIQAQMSNKFNTLDEIREAANDRIVQSNHEKGLLEPYSEKIYNDMDELFEYYPYKDEKYSYPMDTIGYALNDFAGKSKQDVNTLKKVLKEYSFNPDEIPNNLLNQVVDDINSLKIIPTDYFEAKPQRAVGLDEIQQVVIPSNTSQELRDRLQELGIPFTEYNSEVEGDRNRVINQFDDLKFSISQQNDIAPVKNPNLTYGEDIAYQEDIAPTGIDYTIDRDIMDLFHQEIERKGGKKVQLTKPVIAKEKSGIKTTIDTLRVMGTNEFAEISNLAKDSNNPTLIHKADMLNNVAGEVKNSFTTAQTDFNGNEIGEALDNIFDDAKAKGMDTILNDYLLNWSNIDRHKRGKGSQTPLDVSERIVANYEENYPQLKKLAERVWQYGRNELKNKYDVGMISKGIYEANLEAYPHYVPFISDSNNIDKAFNDLKELKVNPIKRAKGGAAELTPVHEALAKYTYSGRLAYRNNELYKEIYKTLNPGTTDIKGAEVGDDFFNGNETLYKNDDGYFLTAIDNGEERKTKISKELYETLNRDMRNNVKNIEEKLNPILKPVQKLSEFRRKILTTWNPVFLVKNVVKDIQDGLLNSKHTEGLIKNYAPGIKELFTDSTPEVRQFKALYGTDALRGQYDDADLRPKKGLRNNKFIKGLINANEIMELAPRYAEFKASLQAGESLEQAMYNAREVTTNFARGGVITKALNRNGFTFLNASVQGFDKFIRNFSGENGAKGIASSLLKALMFGVAPAVFNELVFGAGDDKDEEYDALPDYVKDNYYLIKLGDGHFFRIPKGRALSVFGSAARRTIELAEGEEDAFKGYLSNVNNQIGINNPEENNIFSPFIQAYGSKNGTAWYGGDIVPTRLQDKPKGEQYDASTDKMSIWLGEHLGISPYKFHYVLDQYSGGIGDILLPMITDEAKSNGNILAPVYDQFVVDSVTDNKYVSDFYTKNDELKVKANSSKATDDDYLRNQYMYNISKEMGKLYAERRDIQADNSLSKSEKYEKSQAIKDQINKLAKDGLDSYDNISRTGNFAQVGDDMGYYKNAKGNWTPIDQKDIIATESIGLNDREKSTYYGIKNDMYNIDQKYEPKLKTASDEEKTVLNAQKKVDIINSIKNANLPDEAKAKLYDKKYASTETLDAVIDCGIDFDSYLDLQAQNFTADKNIYGKTINGSKKNKVYNYINNLNMPYEQKIMLAKLEYKSDDTYNREIINYLNNDNSISYQDMTEILKAMGFKVDEYGNITWE